MRVILTKSIHRLGKTGDVVSVRDGYGRNYLIPRSLAVLADEKNVRQINHQKRILQQKLEKERSAAKEIVSKIEALQITIARRVGEGDKLFGSVTNQDIHRALSEAGIDVERRNVVLNDVIKALGTYDAIVKVAPGVDATVKVTVVAENLPEEETLSEDNEASESAASSGEEA